MIKFLQGNCLEKITELKDNSIDCVVSSPPYFGLRDYGVDGQFGLEKTYQEYLSNTVKIFETFKPKLKDTATIWWNVGDSYSGSGKGWSKSLNKNNNYSQGINSGIVFDGSKPKDLLMIPNRVAIALQDAGWYIRSEIIWHKPNPMPESVKDRPTACHEKIWLITKNKKYYYDHEAIKEPTVSGQIKTNIKYGGNKYGDHKDHPTKSGNIYKDTGKRNKRNVWTISPKPFKEAHFATFPPDLIEPCVLAGCPQGGTILDPFGGAGTTGLVAKKHNRNAILIELNPEYIKIAERRINATNKT